MRVLVALVFPKNNFSIHFVLYDLQGGQLAMINLESRAAMLAAKQVPDRKFDMFLLLCIFIRNVFNWYKVFKFIFILIDRLTF